QPDQAERDALGWLEAQDPPEISCGNGHERRVVTHYVPVNDPTPLTRAMSNSYRATIAASQALREAEKSGSEKDIRRAEKLAAKADAKAGAMNAGAATGRESATVLEVLPDDQIGRASC